ncbi:MAG: 50S ribosomal protein L32e [Thermoplasmata archaeon]|nr:50S ribosomal protein L32e [Thermoplasmata archaeon]
MADDETKKPAAEPEVEKNADATDSEPSGAPAATPKKQAQRTRAPPPKVRAKEAAGKKSIEETDVPKAPHRPTLDPETKRLLSVRDAIDDRRPVFGRQAANRYWRIGRWGAWRRPRGLQSKQRRHYGYRAELVSIGYSSPALVRFRTPSGFVPIMVQTPRDLEGLNAQRDAAIIGRTVGTRRRLVLEESARKKGIHVLNPLLKEREEE